ncbi:hypothetical protein [Pseudorhodobacter antarcticus]|uniref:hypothetical protein n=1 Tax=Pseudorhodobacter antarcticus TaxID=1077947 RepID=UPI001113AA0D|nr:hypothetical protein [Pseudorhodobacter antarcticus]
MALVSHKSWDLHKTNSGFAVLVKAIERLLFGKRYNYLSSTWPILLRSKTDNPAMPHCSKCMASFIKQATTQEGRACFTIIML